jgi:EAL domain-containing protein (putative c-di-GMP-specific phosphodiesterase class I)
VDRSFVNGVVDDPTDSAIVSAVIGMGHALGLPVIAEGVETDEQLGTLRRLGCDLAQGYRFARPEPVQAVCDMLRKDPAW